MENFENVWLVLNYNCNNKCKWCYASQQPSKIMSKEKACSIIDFLKELNLKRIILIGGEPTIREDLCDIVRYASKDKTKVGLCSNGRKLEDVDLVKKLVDSGLHGVGISLEGPEEAHDKITGMKGSYKQTVKGIENSVRLGLQTTTNTTICEENSNCLDYLLNFQVDNHLFNVCGPCIGGVEDYSLTPTRAGEILRPFLKRNRDKNIRIVTPLPKCVLDNETFEEHKATSKCEIYFGNNFSVDVDGGVIPCTHLGGFPYFNLFENTNLISIEKFIEEYNNPNGMREQFRNKLWRYPSKECISCDEEYSCLGGCPIFWLKNDPKKELNKINNPEVKNGKESIRTGK